MRLTLRLRIADRTFGRAADDAVSTAETGLTGAAGTFPGCSRRAARTPSATPPPAAVRRAGRGGGRPHRRPARRPGGDAEGLRRRDGQLGPPGEGPRGAAVKKLFALALGILTAIGGFVDIGDLVDERPGRRPGSGCPSPGSSWSASSGSCVFAEMSGRVAAVSGRATFDLVRERLGPGWGWSTWSARWLRHPADLHRRDRRRRAGARAGDQRELAALGARGRASRVWVVLWRVKFDVLENVFGLLGLRWSSSPSRSGSSNPDWGTLVRAGHDAAADRPTESVAARTCTTRSRCSAPR